MDLETKDEVLAVQGTPTQINNYSWEYGHSSITFSNSGKVTKYNIVVTV